MMQVEPDPGAHPEAVAELDVEERPRVRQRTGVDRVEPDVLREREISAAKIS